MYFGLNMDILLTVGLLLENSQHETWRAFKNELPDSDLTLFFLQHKLQWSYQKSMGLLEIYTRGYYFGSWPMPE